MMYSPVDEGVMLGVGDDDNILECELLSDEIDVFRGIAGAGRRSADVDAGMMGMDDAESWRSGIGGGLRLMLCFLPADGGLLSVCEIEVR